MSRLTPLGLGGRPLLKNIRLQEFPAVWTVKRQMLPLENLV